MALIGTLASSSTAIVNNGVAARYDVSFVNNNTSAEVVYLLVANSGGSQYAIKTLSLAAGANASVVGIYVDGADVLYAYATDASQVAYRVTPSSPPTPSGVQVLTSTGAVQSSGAYPSMGTRRLPLLLGRNNDLTVLTATSAANKFQALGTVGTSTYLLGEGAQNNTKTDYWLSEYVLPPEYVAGANLTLTVNVQRVVASGTTLTTTIDCEVWLMGKDALAGSDVCATTVITYTATTATDEPFTITGTTLSPNDRLLIRLTAVATEADNAGTCKNQINSVRIAS